MVRTGRRVVQVSKVISFDLRRAKNNHQLSEYIEPMPNALNAMSSQTDSRGLGWLASSEDVSRQDAGDRDSMAPWMALKRASEEANHPSPPPQ